MLIESNNVRNWIQNKNFPKMSLKSPQARLLCVIWNKVLGNNYMDLIKLLCILQKIVPS